MKKWILIVTALGILAIGVIITVVTTLDWSGSEYDVRRFTLPAYIRQVPRIAMINGSLIYRSSFQDGLSPGFDCVHYRSNANQDEIRASIRSYLLERGFVVLPNESSDIDLYDQEGSNVEVNVILSEEARDMTVSVCNYWE